jgi:hypothetical protein
MVKDEGRQSPVSLLEYVFYQKGSGAPQKPFSSLLEGVRGTFTINTEVGEMTLILHLHFFRSTMSSRLVVRVDIP